MAKLDPQVAAHLEWIGFVRPTGLVVSAPALVRAGVILNRRDAEGQRLLRECVEDHGVDHPSAAPGPRLSDFRTFAESVLGWSFSPKGYAGTADAPIPDQLEVQLPEGGGAFRPDFAVRAEPLRSTSPRPALADDADSSTADEADGSAGDGAAGMTRQSDAGAAGSTKDEPSPWQLLVSVIDTGESFDGTTAGGLELSAQGRMERLLRHTRAPAGLIFNGTALRLVSAPSGENSGWLDFRVADMLQTAGRPICAAMRVLLRQTCLLAVPADKRLAALLRDSRKFQNEVSERLAEQVLHALYELLRGFQAAHDASRGELLGRELVDEPDEIYRGLLTVVLRLVFLLYAEERDMLPQGEVFLGAYSVSGLYERLREDAAVHPDTMDQRYGAYAQLLALWRMVHDGARGPNMSLSARHGDLFHPDRYPFLEGRGGSRGEARQTVERIDSPLVADGTIHRVLEKLIVLDAERISYRALDVEHIGSVYETMMGFRLETATGRSIAIKAAKKHGAPATINIEELLAETPARRAKWLRDRTDRKLTPTVNRAVQQVDSQSGDTIDHLHAALDAVVDKNATPDLVPTGAMVLQPSQERRRSGSHYTPRELTEPIVRIALEPILDRLQSEAARPPRPEQILDLKVCDPAMGSGAFLVEACRQLADLLIESWRAHNIAPEIPPDEDETIFARRMVAQRCLYGVDRNPKAVDLAKLSLWLTTLAKEHPLTFLDHALRHGDSLVGLSISQLQAFHWKGDAPHFAEGFETLQGRAHLDEAAELRQLIREADDSVSDGELRELWDQAQSETAAVRLLGDLTLAAFFQESKPKDREARRKEFAIKFIDGEADTYRPWLEDLHNADPPLAPFHWQIEFPEVFDRDAPGFDSIVGNPPFAGKNTLAASNIDHYSDWLKHAHAASHGAADLVAHFFRRTFGLVRNGGTFGLIATNTISQGDTRYSGLRWICTNGGEVYNARRRFKWPGTAAVVVSIVHVHKGCNVALKYLDGRSVEAISAFLFQGDRHEDPPRLTANSGRSFQGSIVLGMGFTFDDTDTKGVALPLSVMESLIDTCPSNADIIQPYIGGEEVNSHPEHSHHRYVINFRDFPLARADIGEEWNASKPADRARMLREPLVPLDYEYPVAADWRELLEIVEDRVKPERVKLTKNAIGRKRAAFWWQYGSMAKELYESLSGLSLVLVNCRVSHRVQYTFLPSNMVYADSLIVYPLSTYAAFSTLQSRLHESWAHFFGSSMKDDLRYTPSDCFETYPFPDNWETDSAIEISGKEYYEFRAALMLRHDEGMTKTYNRFHDPYEEHSDIVELRLQHEAMDRAVLDAYGWTDIPTDCEFLLDYEIDEETWGNKKKPYRYRWSDDVRDEVLARLLELNDERAADEARAGVTKPKRGGKPRGGHPRRDSAREAPPSATLWDTAR